MGPATPRQTPMTLLFLHHRISRITPSSLRMTSPPQTSAKGSSVSGEPRAGLHGESGEKRIGMGGYGGVALKPGSLGLPRLHPPLFPCPSPSRR